MPPCSISSPEKMKNGMARNENTFMPETIIWIGGLERQAFDGEGRQAAQADRERDRHAEHQEDAGSSGQRRVSAMMEPTSWPVNMRNQVLDARTAR